MTDFECAESLIAAFRTIRQRTLPPYLTQGESVVLANLLERKDRMRSEELRTAAGLSKGRSSNIIKTLERKGYIVRTAGQMNARQTRIRLTEAGAIRTKEQYDNLPVRHHDV